MKKIVLFLIITLFSLLSLADSAYADEEYKKVAGGRAIYRSDVNVECKGGIVVEKGTGKALGGGNCKAMGTDSEGPIVCTTVKNNNSGSNEVGCFVKKSTEQPQDPDGGDQAPAPGPAAPAPASNDSKNGFGVKCVTDKDNNSKIYDGSSKEISICEDGFKCTQKGTLTTTIAWCTNDQRIPLVEGSEWNCQHEDKTWVVGHTERLHRDGVAIWPIFNFGETNIDCPADYKCDKQGERLTCIPADQQPTDGGSGQAPAPQPAGNKPVNIEPSNGRILNLIENETDFEYQWREASNAKKYRVIINSENDTKKLVGNCGNNFSEYFYCLVVDKSPVNVNGNVYLDGKTYTWWVDALDADGKTIGTSDGFTFTVKKTTAGSQPAGNKPAVGGQPPAIGSPAVGGRCSTSCIYSQGSSCYQGNCKDGSSDCSFNVNCGYVGTCAGSGTPVACPGAAPAPAGAPAQTPTQTGRTIDVPCQDNPPVGAGIGERPEGYRWKADCSSTCRVNSDCPKSSSGYVRADTSNWCYGFKSGNRCLMLEYEGESKGGTGTSCTKHTDYGTVTETQVNCVLNLRPTDIINHYKTPAINWCADTTSDKRVIINDWYKKLATVTDKNQVNSCFTASAPAPVPAPAGNEGVGATSPTQVRTTRFYRFAENPVDLQTTEWITYTAGGVNVPNYTFKDPKPGLKTILAEFKYSDGTVTNMYQYYIEFVQPAAVEAPVSLCSSITTQNAAVGTVTYATARFNSTGTNSPTELKLWIASNSDINRGAVDVTSWTPVKTVSNPQSGTRINFDIPSIFAPGIHAVMMTLHRANGLMDGNPGGTVNPNCATSINITAAADERPDERRVETGSGGSGGSSSTNSSCVPTVTECSCGNEVLEDTRDAGRCSPECNGGWCKGNPASSLGGRCETCSAP